VTTSLLLALATATMIGLLPSLLLLVEGGGVKHKSTDCGLVLILCGTKGINNSQNWYNSYSFIDFI
jgi:hypothetical protein